MGPLSFALTLLALGTEAVRDMSFALEGALVANGDEPYCANWEATDPNFPRFCQGAVLSDGSGRRIMDVCSQACSRALAKLDQPASNAQHANPSVAAGVQQARPSGDDPRCAEWYGGGDLKSIYCSSTMHFANDPNQPLIRDVCKDLCSSTADSRDEDDPFCKHYDNQHAEFYCTSGTMATADMTVAQLCKKLCAKHQGGSPPANTGGQVGGTFQNPQQVANGGVPFQASYSQFLNWKPTVATSCPAPGQCLRGGYGEGQRPSFGWDICSGCWQETCVRDLNFEAEARMFRPGSMPADFYAGLKLLEKAYPLGADMWAYQRKLAEREGGDPLGNKLLTGVVGFMNTKDLESWIDCLNSPVHENTHVHHSSTGIFRPSNDMAYGIRAPWMKPCEGGPQNCYYDMEVDWSINSQFPMRGEVRSMFPPDTEDILDRGGRHA